MKKFVINADGNKIKVSDFQESLRKWPQRFTAAMTDDGEAFLTGCVKAESKCGCKIVGNGTLPFPLRIEHCAKHQDKAINSPEDPMADIKNLRMEDMF